MGGEGRGISNEVLHAHTQTLPPSQKKDRHTEKTQVQVKEKKKGRKDEREKAAKRSLSLLPSDSSPFFF
jgi:non-homologous end joining protein Ku